jgi:Tol biopolymer transport system component
MKLGALEVRIRYAALVCAALALALLLLAGSAHAAFPGANGKIAFSSDRSGNREIFTANPDGSGLAKLTKSTPLGNSGPSWSPDGSKIAFDRVTVQGGNVSEIFTMNSDGTNQLQLTHDGVSVGESGWSPDGKKIIFATNQDDPNHSHIHVMNSDGTGETRLTSGPGSDLRPAWSPDGSKIAFTSSRDDPNPTTCGYPNPPCSFDIYTMRPDGTDVVRLTHDGVDRYPQWSPDGAKIAFDKLVFSGNVQYGYFDEIYSMNADGTGEIRITHNADQQANGSVFPVWSPDGSKLAFEIDSSCPPDYCFGASIDTINPDGSGQTRMPVSGNNGGPDWQPIPISGYARPKGATPFQTSLTIAYKPCDSPDEQHGDPLSVPSCSTPQQTSDFLTVGTLDANGQPAKSIGSVRYDVKPGTAANPADDADVKMNISIKDVRMKSDLSDYAGELQVTSARRITDKLNTPAPDATTQAATTQDTPFSITVPCAPTTADTTVGSTCAISTTADAVVPGQVSENARSNWELGQVKVYDGGTDQDADTIGDNTLFMDQGVFVP